MKNVRKVILYIAQSFDGFIARNDGNIDWLSMVESQGEDYGYYNFLDSVDTVIMGRKTYDKILSFGIEFPHKNKKCYVISNKKKDHDENVEFINGNLKVFIETLKSQTGKNIYLDGGGMLVQEMLRLNLIDEMIISIIPILLGEGISLFGKLNADINLKLLSCKKFNSGLAQLHYTLNKVS
ncbi:MAG: dihydrofolate reductase family protein [Spirochaetia bacterium]|nr:dihydrofolate reductase family protein [Spirochaetia bacterium]